MWGRTEVHRGFGWGNLRERHPFDGLGGDRKVILKWILKQPVREGGLDCSDPCEHGNGILEFRKLGEFIS